MSYGTSLEAEVIPTTQASSFTLQYFPYYVCVMFQVQLSCGEYIECFPGISSKFFIKPLIIIIIIIIIINLHFPRIPVAALQSSVGYCPTVTGMVHAGFPRIKSKII